MVILFTHQINCLVLLSPRNNSLQIKVQISSRHHQFSCFIDNLTCTRTSNYCFLNLIPHFGKLTFGKSKFPENNFSFSGNWREKRLLGYSLETSTKTEVKLISCVVSILLSINNDQIERLLAKLEKTLSESFERKIDEFRDDVDIRMDGMNEIMSTTQSYVVTKRKGSVNEWFLVVV